VSTVEGEDHKVPRPEASTDERLDFENLLSELSARFINLPPEKVDEEIERALDQVRSFFQMDRWGLLRVVPGDPVALHISHASSGEGVAQIPKTVNLEPLFPWSARQVVGRIESRAYAKPDELPEEAEQDRRSYAALGIKSFFDIPLVHHGRVSFIFVGNSMHEERVWPKEFVPRLRLLGEIFLNALEHKEADAKLRASEEKFRQFFESSPDYCYIISAEGTILDANESAIQRLGYEKSDLAGRPLEMIYAPESQEKRARLSENWKETGQIRNEEMVILTKSGEKRTVLLNAGAVRGENGTLLHTASIQTDITPRKRMESELTAKLKQIMELKRQLELENIYLREETRPFFRQGNLIGTSPAMKAVMTQIQQVAFTGSTVLLLGETGTGKGLIAQVIHDLSPRKARVMVKVDCASLPAPLIESELFGREKGAYTGALTSQVGRFEAANGSTIFLDEVAELSLELQAKLLRAVQDGEFERLGSSKTTRTDARVIAATNRDLLEEVKKGRFREDLYYRLSVFPIRVPPLRERPEDIPLLVQAFASEFSTKMGKNIRQIPRRITEALQLHDWPGNVRELRNVVEHAFIVSDGDVLNVSIPQERPARTSAGTTLQEAEAGHITRALETCHWRVKGPAGAARLLGLKPPTLYSKMKKLGIQTRRHREG
jgi:formate hydrogenlyase transcriptional activator